MGGVWSKKEVDSSSMEDSNPRYQSQLNSYEAACRADRSLQDFDRTLHDQADRVIRTLAGSAEAQSLALNSIGETTTGVLEMNRALANIILASKEDIWKDKELSNLVEYYFNHGLRILDFFNSLENCLRRARDSQSSIRLALVHFEEERGENVGGERYVRTLLELQRFREAGDPFTEEFSKLLYSVLKQQEEMLVKLEACKKKLDKKVKSAQTWRRVTNAIFMTAFVSTLILSVVAVAIAAPPVVIALAAALAAPIGTVGKWCDSWWKNYRRELKGKKLLVDLMNEGTKISIEDLKTIRSLVGKLEIEIESIVQKADFALGEEQEEAVKLGMLEIKKRAEVFMKTIEDLGTQADKSSREIRMARTVILQKIMGQSSR
ncbi:hypothetical protein EUGRSUZ_H01234 [Eucalyptus grandis]|uniref:Uncharacterized protein n=2 Tax=Eucalyptus grandis TaxID=71139 RepID=A0A059AY52_EUCGR|nr:hypothetical protein EUGRSUZ_H01234 [Eucalyptus grandis]